MSTQMAWPHVLADLVAKRDALTTIIDTIRTHFVGDTPGEMPDSVAVPARDARKTRALKGDGRTDGRTEQESGRRAARSLPDGQGAAILATLKKHGGVMKPGDLSRALKLEPAALRYQLKPLVKSKAVVVTGKTMSRRISLPGANAPKEAP